MRKENIYINLSKCSEEERKHIFSLLPDPKNEEDYMIFDSFYNLHSDNERWYCGSSWVSIAKAELNYPEFIKLFEGVEGENNGWIKIESEADLPKENGAYWTFIADKNEMYANSFGTFNQPEFTFDHNLITHYQPIQKPLPPKF